METEKNFEDKPMVRICAACQNAGEPGNEKFAPGADQSVKDELQQVNKQVKSHIKDFEFSHGACEFHLLQNYASIDGMTPERMASIKTKLVNNPNKLPCLITDKALRHAYMRGIFTNEQMSQVTKSNEHLTERFKKLAGIIS